MPNALEYTMVLKELNATLLVDTCLSRLKQLSILLFVKSKLGVILPIETMY
jgi:hypothetical protein